MPVQVRQIAFLLFWTAFSFGLTLSPALISIGQAGIALVGIFSLKSDLLGKNEKWLSIAFIAFFLSGALSYFYSENSAEAIRKLILKLPILLFPFFIFAFKIVSTKRIWLILIFSYSVFLPAAVSVYNYFLNKQLFDILILESKPLPIEFGYGIYHIQFSILMAISILIGADFLVKNRSKRDLNWYFLSALTIFNFIFIHILSARTGLLSLYLGAALYMFISLKKLGGKWLIYGFLSAIAIILVMTFASSSLKNRLKNSVEDFKVVWKGQDPNDYSFALRVQAWKNSIDLIKKNPMGVGIGDAESSLFNNFSSSNPRVLKDNRKNPHFQLLESGAQSGIISMILYLLIFAISWIKFRQNNLLHSIMLLLFVASCFESILERQASVAAFAIFAAYALLGNSYSVNTVDQNTR